MKNKWIGMLGLFLIGTASIGLIVLLYEPPKSVDEGQELITESFTPPKKQIPEEILKLPKGTNTTTEKNSGNIETATVISGADKGLDMNLLNFLAPANNEQEVHLENSAYVVNKQAKNENGTLEVKQIIGDNNMIYLLIDFTAVEGTLLNAKQYRFTTDFSLDTEGPYSAGYNYILLNDGNHNDNKISLMMSISTTDRAIAGSSVTLLVSDLEAADVYPDKFETIVSGSWETQFKLDYKDISTTYQLQQDMTLYNYAATLSSISISPFSVTLKVESAHTQEIDEEARRSSKEIGPNKYADYYPITLHYKGGRSETTSVFKGFVQADHLSDTTTIVKPFVPIINEKEIKLIEFFNTVIALD
ncbi:hypothetical protein [Paenibacillus mucilaginosus]|uniref:DUF4179 domain-containing protein n=1 Tax=Paenibacillus mucilaginosus (strain KNP414) TaxID=1036673 RepID=F8FJP7_PAEMK|nr:hypothetical protein [Paenibacillus mucilaginosus]AEI42897.1 hypothetical protein KNP414_04365 [Paenibacillus mucilaginosus KNP414]MCG7216017.1 hypothetical protein [Paenibacillus mucilaginosus]WDM31061.1 hypothetical protein KCX80_18740 [Paenibacillus mucilaginosus]